MTQRVRVRLSSAATWYFAIARIYVLLILAVFIVIPAVSMGIGAGGIVLFSVPYVLFELALADLAWSIQVEVDASGISTKSFFGSRLLPWDAKGYYVDLQGNVFIKGFYKTNFDAAPLTGRKKYWRDIRSRCSLRFLFTAYYVPKAVMIDNLEEILAVVRGVDSDYVKKIWLSE